MKNTVVLNLTHKLEFLSLNQLKKVNISKHNYKLIKNNINPQNSLNKTT